MSSESVEEKLNQAISDGKLTKLEIYKIVSSNKFQELFEREKKNILKKIKSYRKKKSKTYIKGNLSRLKFKTEIEKENDKKAANIFYNIIDKIKIPNLSIDNILKIADYDYINAITILLIYKNEQGSGKLRKIKKDIGRGIDEIYKNNINSIIYKALLYIAHHKDKLVHSLGFWQIRSSSISNEELEKIFKSSVSSFNLSQEEKYEFNKYIIQFFQNKNSGTILNNHKFLDKKKIEKLLENKKFANILLKFILKYNKVAVNYYLDKLGIQLNKNNKNYIKFYSSLLANAFHMGPGGAVKTELFTDISLKIAEKLNLLENKEEVKNYQKTLRDEYDGKPFIRNVKIQKRTILLILNHILKKSSGEDKNKIQQLINKAQKIDLTYDSTSKIYKYILPKEVISFIIKLAKIKKVNPLNFTQEDYKNTNPKKAILVSNYGALAWRRIK